MADIALLVAEEYEKIKRWQREGEAPEGLDCVVSSFFSSLDRRAEAASPSPAGEEKKVVVGLAWRALEPRSSFGLALMEGFFPA